MITVTVFVEKESPVGFSVSGHANRGDYGEDLVCAAVSAIAQTAYLGITEVLNLQAGVSIQEGDMTCILDRDTGATDLERAAIVIQTMERGLRSIQASYPGTLKFRSKEV